MSAQHTPGPWHFEQTEHGISVWATRSGDDDKSIATMSRFGPEDLRVSHAHLIAAAPELYEALARLLQHCPTHSQFDDPEEHLYGAALERARAAIAKAEGSTT